ncbi:hypothetical protein B6E66_07270 [Streptomyces maremycinicus]|nr:hypothetical protein B6E66_07270 [Streptomyces sp. B9173]
MTNIDTAADAARVTALAGALYVANAAYTEALKMPAPATTLDSICDDLHEVLPQVLGVIKTTPELAEVLTASVADRLWAFAAIEHGRAEAGDGYGYVFDLLADNLRAGGDPSVARTTALAVPARIRAIAEAAA